MLLNLLIYAEMISFGLFDIISFRWGINHCENEYIFEFEFEELYITIDNLATLEPSNVMPMFNLYGFCDRHDVWTTTIHWRRVLQKIRVNYWNETWNTYKDFFLCLKTHSLSGPDLTLPPVSPHYPGL